MKYMGSKSRIAKHILPIMLADAEKHGITTWVEPFVGGANMIDKVPESYKRIGIDLNEHTIAALLAVRDFSNGLPDAVSEDAYKKLKGQSASPISSWIRFAASFSGKFENGYARQGDPLKYKSSPVEEGKRNALKQSPKIQSVEFICASYLDYKPVNSLVYCDPPYQGTTGYKTGAFNHEEFFEWCRVTAKNGNLVYVSEYNAPLDFEVVWQGEISTNFASQRKEATHKAVEKLFKVKGRKNEIFRRAPK
jgi:DNA adenine methylase